MDNDLLILAMISLAGTLLLALATACLQWAGRNARRAWLRPLALRALDGSVAPVFPALAAIATFLYLDHIKPLPAVGMLTTANGQAIHLILLSHGNVALQLWEDRVRTANLLVGAFTLLTLVAVAAFLLFSAARLRAGHDPYAHQSIR